MIEYEWLHKVLTTKYLSTEMKKELKRVIRLNEKWIDRRYPIYRTWE